jgi:PAS domain S-box-containing protein
MDIKLKGEMDGVEAAKRIRRQLNVPIVYLTAYTDDKAFRRAKVTEPFGYIVKPFQERDLQITIEMALYKHQMEQKLKEREQWLATTLRSIGEAVIATDGQGRIIFMNIVAEALTGWAQAEALGQELSAVFKVVDEETRRVVKNPAITAIREGVTVALTNHTLLITKENREIPIADRAAPIKDEQGHIAGAVLTFQDYTQRRQVEEEREALIHRLQEAISAIKTLRGIIPICSSCKKIRDEVGEWQQVEVYIRDRTEAEFTHSLCPDCARELFPDIDDDDEK